MHVKLFWELLKQKQEHFKCYDRGSLSRQLQKIYHAMQVIFGYLVTKFFLFTFFNCTFKLRTWG